jgi:hypothetical protein
MRFRHGDAVAPLKVVGARAPGAQRQERHRSHLPALHRHLHQDGRIRFRQDAGAPPARAGLPQFRRAHRAQATARRRAVQGRNAASTKAASRPSSNISTAKTAGAPSRSRHRAEKTASPSKWRCGGTTATTKTCCASPTTSRSATAAPTWPASAAR